MAKRKSTARRKTTKRTTLKEPFWKRQLKPILTGLLFAVVGTILLIQTMAASNSVTYSGLLNKGNTSQNYSISAGDSGLITATHNSKDANIRISILDSNGSALAEEIGKSAKASAEVTPGDFTIRVDYMGEIKGAKKFDVTITYPIIEETEPPAGDTTPPTVIITSPTESTVSGSVDIAATANDNVTVSSVEFAVDGVVLINDSSSPYGFRLDSTTVSNGTHVVVATAYDDAGNKGTASLQIEVLNETTSPPPTSYSDPIWHADADTDRIVDAPSSSNTGETTYWDRMEQSNLVDRLIIVNDPLGLYGKVYSANLTPNDIAAGNKRAEWAQMKDEDGSRIRLYADGNTNVYFGWRALFGTEENLYLGGNDNDGNYMQLKGDSSCGGPAVGLTIRNNRLAIRTIDGDYIAWDGPLMTSLLDNKWHSIVLHVNLAKDNSGYVSIWLDGVQQTMNNQETRINLPTVCPNDTYVYPKLGVYGMDKGNGTGPLHLIESPRIGKSFDSVVPR